MYILKVYLIHCIHRMYIEMKQINDKKISLEQDKQYKYDLFFLSRTTTHHSFSFNSRFLIFIIKALFSLGL